MSYSEVSIAGYNSSPPPDDGAAGPTNQVKWATIKSKLFDPLRVALDLIDDRVASAILTADTTSTTLASTISTLSANVIGLQTALSAPATTAMLFRQTAAPTGWTKALGLNDYALRVTSGTASTGGTTAFTAVLAGRNLTVATMPSHAHSFSDAGSNASFSGDTVFLYDITDSGSNGLGGSNKECYTNIDNNNDTVTGTWTFSVSSGNPNVSDGVAWDFDVQYVDVIAAVKN